MAFSGTGSPTRHLPFLSCLACATQHESSHSSVRGTVAIAEQMNGDDRHCPLAWHCHLGRFPGPGAVGRGLSHL